MRWHSVGNVLPTELTDARLQLHWAAQLVSAPGATWLPPQADFSHTNLGWDTPLGVLAGRDVGEASLRAALVFEALELVVLEGRRERATLSLAGETMDEALRWLGERMEAPDGPLMLPVHEMPAHPVGEGAPFSEADSGSRAELAAWFANASAAVHQAVDGRPGASLVRAWPHHFDIASLITLDQGKDSEEARSIGVGFSPGDGSYDQPYFYVTPWPYPTADVLPELARGARWHTEGWTGAVLTAERIISTSPDAQVELVADLLEGTIAVCHRLLGG